MKENNLPLKLVELNLMPDTKYYFKINFYAKQFQILYIGIIITVPGTCFAYL